MPDSRAATLCRFLDRFGVRQSVQVSDCASGMGGGLHDGAGIVLQHPDPGRKVAGVTKSAIAIWKATLAWPCLDPEAEIDFVGNLDAALGINADETENLLRHYVELNRQLENR